VGVASMVTGSRFVLSLGGWRLLRYACSWLGNRAQS
jgi:hypothetical protein